MPSLLRRRGRTETPANFTDVLLGEVFRKHVGYLCAKGIIAGCGAATHCPQAFSRLFAPSTTGEDQGGIMNRRLGTSVAALLSLLALPAVLAAQEHPARHKHYTFVDIGTFGGPN